MNEDALFAGIRGGDRAEGIGQIKGEARPLQADPPRVESDGTVDSLGEVLEQVGRLLKRRAVVCVLSDFLGDSDWLRPMAVLSRRHQVSAFLLHDPLEASLPGVRLVELEDAETRRRRLVDARSLLARVPLEARLRDLRRAGARARAVGTGEDPFRELLAHFRSVERRR